MVRNVNYWLPLVVGTALATCYAVLCETLLEIELLPLDPSAPTPYQAPLLAVILTVVLLFWTPELVKVSKFWHQLFMSVLWCGTIGECVQLLTPWRDFYRGRFVPGATIFEMTRTVGILGMALLVIYGFVSKILRAKSHQL